jgi:hypothetical protein
MADETPRIDISRVALPRLNAVTCLPTSEQNIRDSGFESRSVTKIGNLTRLSSVVTIRTTCFNIMLPVQCTDIFVFSIILTIISNYFSEQH